tara:strand:+ start:1070 stop:2005 length:936 start_codon:yes stop_codon:yes gene_type:complete
VIKYLNSILFCFLLLSCNELNIDSVNSAVENSTNKIGEIIKTKNENTKQELKPKEKLNNNTIFYYIGEPYFIEGVSYTPEENYNYSEIGLASYFGKELHNIKTINNDLNKVTELVGRHKTLPLPSMVKITNLDNGLSINVKIIDRHDNNAVVIEVSRKVAQLLGFYKSKLATVKVEILTDASKQWKSVVNSMNEKNFEETISSAPTDIVSIIEIDETVNIKENTNEITQEPIELKSEKIIDFKLYLKISGFKNYDNIRLIIDNYDNKLKYTSVKKNSIYEVIIGPIDNNEANNLVSYFISKGYKDTEILIE